MSDVAQEAQCFHRADFAVLENLASEVGTAAPARPGALLVFVAVLVPHAAIFGCSQPLQRGSHMELAFDVAVEVSACSTWHAPAQCDAHGCSLSALVSSGNGRSCAARISTCMLNSRAERGCEVASAANGMA